MRFLSSLLLLLPVVTWGLDNGVARTPPMGFISWQRFGAETNCDAFPDTCISEKLYLEIAQAMKDRGLVDAGYVYVNIDDNWSLRDSNKVADHNRFPNGMKFIADKLISMGMKFGMYTDIGSATCQGYTSLNMDDPNSDASVNEFIDQMFEWGVESLKVDGCNSNVSNFVHTYPKLSQMILARRAVLNQARTAAGLPTYPPLMLSCSWPAYQGDHGVNPRDMYLLREHCNLWRNQGDINDSFVVMRAIVDWYAWYSQRSSDLMVSAAGPGNWNDPDMLLIGNNGLSIEQQKTQFNLWAIMASPLYISADVRTMSEESLNILKNKKVIAINQDPLGRQGWVIDWIGGWMRVWMRPLSTDSNGHSRTAVLFENLRQEFYWQDYTLDLGKLGWSNYNNWKAEDCWTGEIRTSATGGGFKVRLDENTSKIFVFTDLTGSKAPEYPSYQFSESDAQNIGLTSSSSSHTLIDTSIFIIPIIVAHL